jgi:hypothetical protein
MDKSVAINTQCDQILLAVLAIVTAEFLVMDLKVIFTATVLAFPPVSRQDLHPEGCIGCSIQTHQDVFCENSVHDTFPSAWARNSCFWSRDRNL